MLCLDQGAQCSSAEQDLKVKSVFKINSRGSVELKARELTMRLQATQSPEQIVAPRSIRRPTYPKKQEVPTVPKNVQAIEECSPQILTQQQPTPNEPQPREIATENVEELVTLVEEKRKRKRKVKTAQLAELGGPSSAAEQETQLSIAPVTTTIQPTSEASPGQTEAGPESTPPRSVGGEERQQEDRQHRAIRRLIRMQKAENRRNREFRSQVLHFMRQARSTWAYWQRRERSIRGELQRRNPDFQLPPFPTEVLQEWIPPAELTLEEADSKE